MLLCATVNLQLPAAQLQQISSPLCGTSSAREEAAPPSSRPACPSTPRPRRPSPPPPVYLCLGLLALPRASHQPACRYSTAAIATPDWAAERALMIVRTSLSNMHRTAIAKYATRRFGCRVQMYFFTCRTPFLLSSLCAFRAPVLSQRAEQQR